MSSFAIETFSHLILYNNNLKRIKYIGKERRTKNERKENKMKQWDFSLSNFHSDEAYFLRRERSEVYREKTSRIEIDDDYTFTYGIKRQR
jgi:hypothetical protein